MSSTKESYCTESAEQFCLPAITIYCPLRPLQVMIYYVVQIVIVHFGWNFQMKRLKLFVENHSNIPVIHDLKEDPIGKMAGNKKHDNVVDQGCQTFPLPPRMDWTSPFQRFVKQK